MGGPSGDPGSRFLYSWASFWGKRKFYLSWGSEPLSRETIWMEDSQSVLQVQQTCLGWTQLFTAASLYLGPTLPVEQRSHFPFFRGRDGWDSDIPSWRESPVMDWPGGGGPRDLNSSPGSARD